MNRAELGRDIEDMRKAAQASVIAGLRVLSGCPVPGMAWRVTVKDHMGYRVWTIQGGLLDVLNAYGKSEPGCAGEIVSIVREAWA